MSMFLQQSGWWCHQRQHLLCPWAVWRPKSHPGSPWWGGWHPGESGQSHSADALVCFSPPDGLWRRENVRGGEREDWVRLFFLTMFKELKESPETMSRACCDSIVIPSQVRQRRQKRQTNFSNQWQNITRWQSMLAVDLSMWTSFSMYH